AATPLSRTRLVTRLGVSVLKVVATMETPISHQGAACPEVKNSEVLDPARRAMSSAGMSPMASEATMIAQSVGARCMRWERGHAERGASRAGSLEGPLFICGSGQAIGRPGVEQPVGCGENHRDGVAGREPGRARSGGRAVCR